MVKYLSDTEVIAVREALCGHLELEWMDETDEDASTKVAWPLLAFA